MTRVQDVGLAGAADPVILGWAASEGRILLTHDAATMPGFAYARLMQYTLPNAGTSTFFIDNIDTNRSATVPIVDLRVDKAFSVGKFKFTGMFDLFNAMNSNAVTNFFLTNGSNYDRIIATLDPRTAQVGVRFEF